MENNITYPVAHSQVLDFNTKCIIYREGGNIYQAVFINRCEQGREEVVARYWSVFGEKFETFASRAYKSFKGQNA